MNDPMFPDRVGRLLAEVTQGDLMLVRLGLADMSDVELARADHHTGLLLAEIRLLRKERLFDALAEPGRRDGRG